MSDFIGSGWSVPVRCDATSSIATNTGHQRIQQAIRVILSTAPGERPHRPEFGCGIHDLVFEARDARLAGRIEQSVRRALRHWEPRIDVTAVGVAEDPQADDRLLIDVAYRVRATGDHRNLVYPFYTVGSEGR